MLRRAFASVGRKFSLPAKCAACRNRRPNAAVWLFDSFTGNSQCGPRPAFRSRSRSSSTLSGYTPLLAGSHVREGVSHLRIVLCLLISVPCLFFPAFIASAQIPPLKPPPLATQVPQGSGTCSVEKSCADLAPQMDPVRARTLAPRREPALPH